MKVIQFFSKFTWFRVYLLFIFLIITLLWNSNYSAGTYLLMLMIAILPLYKNTYRFIINSNKFLFFLPLLSCCIYLVLAKSINSIELWGDEIHIVQIPTTNFKNIISSQIAAPPLDIWNMWIWKNMTIGFPREWNEFVFRIPYMLFHIAASLVFMECIRTFIHSQKRNSIHWKVPEPYLLTFAYLLYFFNPLLILYSIETRYYIFSALATTILLLLVLKNKLYDLTHLPLLLLFNINSILQWVVNMICLFFFFGHKTQKKIERRIVILSHLLLFCILWKTILLPKWAVPTLYAPSFNPSDGLYLIWSYLIHLFFQAPLAAAAIGFILFRLKYIRAENRSNFVFFLFYSSLLIFLFITQYTGYPFFASRHLVILSPLILFLVTTQLLLSLNAGKILVVPGIIGCIIYGWFSIQPIRNQHLYSKDLKGYKYVIVQAKQNKSDIIILNNTNIPEGLYGYYVESFLWYLSVYPEVHKIVPQTENEAWKYFKDHKNSIIYSFSPEVKIPAAIPVSSVHTYNAFIGFH